MASLFEHIAKEHGVPVGVVSGALGRNRAGIDLAINVPFTLFYCLAATAVARWLWRNYPPVEDRWIPGATIALFLSLAMAVGSTMIGEVWSVFAESFRVGNGHMSHRVQRLWWGRHRAEVFAGAMIAFWLAAAEVARRMRSKIGVAGQNSAAG
jgi:hypothetical protein